jgi:tetratricopeptide (TPR) repeat protein
MRRATGIHIDNPKKVGSRLLEARKKAGLSQRELASGLCTSAYISRVEDGQRDPSLQLLAAFAPRLNVSTDFLATGVEAAEGIDSEVLDAELALRLGEIDDARRLFERLSQLPGPSGASGLAGLGQIAYREGDLFRAIDLLEQCIDDQPILTAPNVADTLGRSYAATGDFEAASALLTRAFDEAQAADAPADSLRFGVLLANTLTDSGHFHRAEAILASVIEHAERVRDPTAAARVYWTQSRLHVLRGDPALGVRYARRAIEILERAEDDSYTAMAYHLLAYAEVESGDADSALEHLGRGRELFGDRFGEYDEAKFSVEEARALLSLRRIKSAAKVASRALAVIDVLEPGDRGRAYVVLADVFSASGETDRAEELLRLALDYLLDTGKPYVMDAATRLSELLERRGQVDEALQVLRNALATTRAAVTTMAPIGDAAEPP